MSAERDALIQAVTELQRVYEVTRRKNADLLATWYAGSTTVTEPEHLLDANGRSVLLDALTTIVSAQTVLTETEGS